MQSLIVSSPSLIADSVFLGPDVRIASASESDCLRIDITVNGIRKSVVFTGNELKASYHEHRGAMYERAPAVHARFEDLFQ